MEDVLNPRVWIQMDAIGLKLGILEARHQPQVRRLIWDGGDDRIKP